MDPRIRSTTQLLTGDSSIDLDIERQSPPVETTQLENADADVDNEIPEDKSLFEYVSAVLQRCGLLPWLQLRAERITHCFSSGNRSLRSKLNPRIILPHRLHSLIEFAESKRGKRMIRIAVDVTLLLTTLAMAVYFVAENAIRLVPFAGVITFLLIAWLLSVHKRYVNWSLVLWGICLQFWFGVLVLHTESGLVVFSWVGDNVQTFLDYTDTGSKMVFGDPDYKHHYLLFKVFPVIIFFSTIISILYHIGAIQLITKVIAWLMMKTMGTSGAESLSCAANIFLGQTEAPLLIKPYIESMTLSELNSVMSGGFATVSGATLATFISFGISAQYLIAASVLNAPASLAISKIMHPETRQPKTKNTLQVQIEKEGTNLLDAATAGALQGGRTMLSIVCVLIAFVSLIALVNGVLSGIGVLISLPELSMDWLLSYLMFPVALVMGVPVEDCGKVAILLGKKTVINEFVAYLDLKTLIEAKALTPRAELVATFALCGFSNFSSIAIQIGCISSFAPTRRQDLARLGLRAMISGTLACFLTASVASLMAL